MMRFIRSPIAGPLAAGIVAIGLFSLMDAIMKQLALDYGALNAVFWRNLVGVGLTGTLAWGLRTPWPDRAGWRTFLLRGGVITVASLTFFFGLTRMPLADAIALSFVAPLLMIVLAAVLLGETIRASAIVAALLGLCGVAVIMAGQVRGLDRPGAWVGGVAVLVSAVAYAFAQVILRRQAQVHPPLAIAFYPSLVVVAALAAPVALAPAVPRLADLPLFALAAALAAVCQLLLVWAYARAEAQRMAIVEYTAFIWAALFGHLFFAEAVTAATLGGAALIILACIIALRR